MTIGPWFSCAPTAFCAAPIPTADKVAAFMKLLLFKINLRLPNTNKHPSHHWMTVSQVKRRGKGTLIRRPSVNREHKSHSVPGEPTVESMYPSIVFGSPLPGLHLQASNRCGPHQTLIRIKALRRIASTPGPCPFCTGPENLRSTELVSNCLKPSRFLTDQRVCLSASHPLSGSRLGRISFEGIRDRFPSSPSESWLHPLSAG